MAKIKHHQIIPAESNTQHPSPHEMQDTDGKDGVFIKKYFADHEKSSIMMFRRVATTQGYKMRSLHFNKAFLEMLGWVSEEF